MKKKHTLLALGSLAVIVGIYFALAIFFWDGPAAEAIEFMAVSLGTFTGLTFAAFVAYIAFTAVLIELGWYDRETGGDE